MAILSTAYLGNLHYYARLLAPGAAIDLHEHYVKQSFRNRCVILSAGGPLTLAVPVHHSGSVKTPVRDIRIDHSKRWQHRHWQAICSAYRNSPYFVHYEADFAPFYEKQFSFLADLNNGLQETVLRLLGVCAAPAFTEAYAERVSESADFRASISPKRRLQRPDPAYTPPEYWQVFGDRFPFESDLSVIDLLFCEGPGALGLLRAALKF